MMIPLKSEFVPPATTTTARVAAAATASATTTTAATDTGRRRRTTAGAATSASAPTRRVSPITTRSGRRPLSSPLPTPMTGLPGTFFTKIDK